MNPDHHSLIKNRALSFPEYCSSECPVRCGRNYKILGQCYSAESIPKLSMDLFWGNFWMWLACVGQFNRREDEITGGHKNIKEF